MATASQQPATVTEVPPLSMVVVLPPPDLLDDGDREVFVRVGPHARRPVRRGDHLEPDDGLVVRFPDCFRPSLEPVDVVVVISLTPEARERQRAEQVRLAAHPARKVVPCCARCGAEGQPVIVFDQPAALDLLSELSAIEDAGPEVNAQRWRIEQKYAAMARAHQEQQLEVQRVEGEFRREHLRCPEGTPPMPEPAVPESPPLFYRLGYVRSAE